MEKMQSITCGDIENQGMIAQDDECHPVEELGMIAQDDEYHPVEELGMMAQNLRYRRISAVPVDEDRGRKVWLIPTIAIILTVLFGITVHKNNCPENKALNESNIKAENDGSENSAALFDEIACFPESFGRFSLESAEGHDDVITLGVEELTSENMGGYNEAKLPNEPWRLFTSFWLHNDLSHLILNLAILLVVGVLLEHKFGWVLVGIIYIVSGFGSTMVVHFIKEPFYTVSCSSGPIFGLVGAMLSELFTNWNSQNNKLARFILVTAIILVNTIYEFGYSPIGGGLVGFLLGLILLPRPQPQYKTADSTITRKRYGCCQVTSGILALIVLIVIFAALVINLIRFVQFRRELEKSLQDYSG